MANFLVLFSFFLVISSFAIIGAQSKVETFTYVNSGEFGPYITEYDADYRVLPVATSPFQMAFYNTTPGQFYLALRMGTVRSESTFRWVWEANRGRPVHENATFSLLPDGDLVLTDADRRIVWSTGTANKGVVGLKILPNGNIVLYDAKGRFVWQSFDSPTDTLLSGQSLRLAGPRKLVSRRSSTDVTSGIYSLVLESGGLTMYIDNAGKSLPYQNYSDGFFTFNAKSMTFSCDPETEEAYAYECQLAAPDMGAAILSRPKYNATLSILRLGMDGNLAVYTFYAPVDYRAWEETFALFSDEIGLLDGCMLPSKCGGFGLCKDEMCVACPSPRGLLGWSKSCGTPSLGSCRINGGGKSKYYKVAGVETFLSKYTAGEGAVRKEECERRCSADCKCLGYLYWEKEGKCWLAPLLGTLSSASVEDASHVIYVKY